MEVEDRGMGRDLYGKKVRAFALPHARGPFVSVVFVGVAVVDANPQLRVTVASAIAAVTSHTT
jgi:hypothetical protein